MGDLVIKSHNEVKDVLCDLDATGYREVAYDPVIGM